MKVKVVMPWRPSASRLPGFEWVCGYYKHRLGSDCIHISPGPKGPFNRAKAINDGVRQYPGHVIIIGDADCFLCDSLLQRAIDEIDDYQMIIPHNRFCKTTPSQKRWLLGRSPEQPVSDRWFRKRRSRMAQAGIWVVTHDFFMDDPMDERFHGWGCEDTEYLRRVESRRLRGTLFHIHHKRPSKRYYRRNKNLHRSIIREEMLLDEGDNLEAEERPSQDCENDQGLS